MKDLTKRNADVAKVQKTKIDLYPGDRFIDHDGRFYLVKAVKDTKDGKGCVKYISASENATDPETYVHSSDFEYFQNGHYVKVDETGTPDEVEAKMFAKALQTTGDDEQAEQSTSKEIATCLDKNSLIAMQKGMEEKKRSIEIISRFLEGKRSELRHIMSTFQAQIEKVQGALFSIELYLGINEDILRIQEGEAAGLDVPITFRQQTLFIDEEVGDIEDGGLDFQNLEEFDAWLLKDGNYKKVLPEEKGVVCMKPRRHDKKYYSDARENSIANMPNHKTYIFIRNGQNFYRIWSDLEVGEEMFPSAKTMNELSEKIEQDHHFDKRDAEKEMLQYKRCILMLQGLLDRTHIFKPIKPGLMLTKPQTYMDGCVKFIYDNEPALTMGHKNYTEWKKDANEKIIRGTRVYFMGRRYYSDSKYWCQDHLLRYGSTDIPGRGIYSVMRMDESEKNAFVCLHSPSDEVWTRYGGYKPRQRREAFRLWRDDHEVFNYDLLSMDDIKYFIADRWERKNYLDILPVLYGLRRERLSELEWEKGFVANLVLRINHPDAEAATWQAIEWWKRKVIWKRPIMKEDAKALRMITGRVKRMLFKKK